MNQKIISSYQNALHENLISILTYNQNILIVTKELDFDILTKLLNETILLKLRRIPLILTEDEIKASLDTFPLEFLNIKTDHSVEFGRDIFKDLKIEKKHVRDQLEFEFRSKLIKLRQSYLETAEVRPGLQRLLESALPTLLPIAKGLLYLKNKEIPKDQKHIFAAVDNTYHVKFTFYEKIVSSQDKNLKLKKQDMKEIIKDLSDFLYKMSAIVDGMDV